MIHCLVIYFMDRHAHFIRSMFGKLRKGWESGKSFPVVRYYEYDADRDLCVRAILDVYLEKLSHGGLTKGSKFY